MGTLPGLDPADSYGDEVHTYDGPATAVVDGRAVGQVRVRLQHGPLDPERGDEPWSGTVANSDYVLWGLAGSRFELRLPDGSTGECVVRSTGTIVGFGEPPFSNC